MGGIISFYLNVHYSDLLAVSLYAGTHWDFQQLKEVLPKQKFFYIASELDKAAPIMQQMETFFEQENIAYATTKFAANLPDKQKEEAIKKLLKKGADKNIVQFTKGTVFIQLLLLAMLTQTGLLLMIHPMPHRLVFSQANLLFMVGLLGLLFCCAFYFSRELQEIKGSLRQSSSYRHLLFLYFLMILVNAAGVLLLCGKEVQ